VKVASGVKMTAQKCAVTVKSEIVHVYALSKTVEYAQIILVKLLKEEFQWIVKAE
jgi:hypothetical protein